MSRIFLSTFVRAVALLMTAGVLACAANPGMPGSTEAPANNSRPEDFRLGTGDKVRVIVFGADKLGGEFTIDPDGALYIPLVGAIGVSGSTLNEAAAKIAKRLRDEKMVDNAQVSVVLTEARPFYIYGEVTKSGSYPYLPGMNVLSAIATAGGFTYRATEGHVFVRHGGTGSEVEVDLTDGAKPPMPIYPGDIIRVPGRFF
jgi:protein involved in polysaccharide export with SLBB domain